jgi:hypothetical protein
MKSLSVPKKEEFRQKSQTIQAKDRTCSRIREQNYRQKRSDMGERSHRYLSYRYRQQSGDYASFEFTYNGTSGEYVIIGGGTSFEYF